jgi:VWFA-related protein
VLALTFAAPLLAGVTALSGQSSTSPQVPPEPQQPGVTFRAEVNYVEVDARVVDEQGRFIANLTPKDFQLFEDGKPQQVSAFSLVNIPVERDPRPLFANRPIERDVQTNLSSYSGRVYLIVLDDTHTQALLTPRTKMAARSFVERYMGANDVAAIVHTSGRSDAAQEFTSNQRLLLQAIDKFMGQKLRSAVVNRIEEEARTRGMRTAGEPIGDIDAMERGLKARNTLDSLRAYAQVLEGVRGRRKALVLFSEGIDYDITDPFNNRDATTIIDATQDAIAAATRANVAFYGVDVRGLSAGMETGIEIGAFPEDLSLGLDSRALANEVRLGQDSLRVLSEETGGFAVVNNNDTNGAFQRLVEENSSYYVLGYYPANDRRDGRFRKIEVRVNRPGVKVSARRGYVAPRGRAQEAKLSGPNDASPELREAISSPVPVAGLPLAVTASVFKGPDNKGSAVISTTIGGSDLSLVESNGVFKNDLEISWIATDTKGKVFPGDRNTLNLTLKPDTVTRLRSSGFRVITSMDLPPGRYQLRVAAREANTRRAGAVFYDIDVPEFSKEPLSISGLALTSAASGAAPTARPKDPLTKLLPGPLSTYRDFVQNDEVAIFTEVYESAGGPAHKVEIRLNLQAEGGQSVFQTREERDSSELKGSSGGYGFSARIPLRNIAPGLYVLRVEAESRVADRLTVGRETLINVLPGVPDTNATAKPAPSTGTPPSPSGATAPNTPAPTTSAPNAPAPNAPAPNAPAPAAPVAPVAPVAPSTPVQTTTINSDMMSGIDRPEQLVLRTAAEWQTAWQRHAPGRPAPGVDFNKNMVVAVFLGSRPSGGYQVEITGVRTNGKTLVVQWAERQPGPGQMAAQVMTAPSHIVTVPRHEGEVRFEKAQ